MKILYFAALRDKMGMAEEDVQIGCGVDVAYILEKHIQPKAGKEACDKLAFAVNEEHAKPDTKLDNRYTLAVFPPFSGGI